MISPSIVRSRFEEELQKAPGFTVKEKQPEGAAGQGGTFAWVDQVNVNFIEIGDEDGSAPGGANIGQMPTFAAADVVVMAAFDLEDRGTANVRMDQNITALRSAMSAAANRLNREDEVILRWVWGEVNIQFGAGENPNRHGVELTINLSEK